MGGKKKNLQRKKNPDIYAGQLDGINWRVTLGPDGEPRLYDAIHNCGCYHEFFPSRHLRLRGDLPAAYFEPPLLPQTAPEQQPLVLRIAHHTHFIQRVYHDASPLAVQPMAWEEYDALRSLPVDGTHRSLFGEYGLIAGTERAERFILWPMGIRSPGAMRQWGRHANINDDHLSMRIQRDRCEASSRSSKKRGRQYFGLSQI